MTKRKYYPNNWKKIKAVPSDYFDSLPFEDFMSWRVHQWELPSSVTCLIREEDLLNGKIVEYSYDKPSAARERIKKIMDKGHEFTLVNHQECRFFEPHYTDEEDYDDTE